MPVAVVKKKASSPAGGEPARAETGKGAAEERFGARPESAQSGNLSVTLGSLPGGSRFGTLAFNVTGDSFYGRLKNFSGVAVTESPVVYDTDGASQAPGNGSQRAFILDFGGLRSLLNLAIDRSAGRITLVLPWLGTAFADKSLYPSPASGPDYKPKRDGTGDFNIRFPSADTQKLLVQVQPISGNAFSVAQLQDALLLTTATFPSNVKAALEGRLPFWTHPGVLHDSVPVTGLDADLNALLAGKSGNVPVKLVMTTDTPGVLSADLKLSSLQPALQAAAQWGGKDSLDIPLQALQEASVAILFPYSGSSSWNVAGLGLTLKGKFPAWRAFPAQAEADPGGLGFSVNARFSAARALDFGDAVDLYGVTLPLPSSDCALVLELYADSQGQPAAGKPLATAPLNLKADAGPAAGSDAGGSPPVPAVWTDAFFPSPLRLKPGRYWLTAKAKTGSAEWRGCPVAVSEAPTLVSQEGGPWRGLPRLNPHAPTAATPLFPGAQALILRKPLPKENDALLDLIWDAGAASTEVSGEPQPDAADLSLNLPAGVTQTLTPSGGLITLPIQARARATGTLTLSATAAYKEKAA